VIVTDNGASVLELTHREKPDLILMDILLPGLDGLELCLELCRKTDVPVDFHCVQDRYP